ncbi:MAG: 50S ribosomal protein L13 [Candidatus Omnitrophica bacterium]|nr:50S ribosomal protein L13 [Candidatus Omnitrophota bacterium]MDD5671305.1 50S ribosomal protein L13 [Candidatus Omnitrophota bacterium]
MKTFIPKEKDFDRKTYLLDATGKTLGRLATRVSSLLIGKHKTVFAQDQISGDQVIVINATKVHVTGNKIKQKVYNHFTGYRDGLRLYTYEELMAKDPEEIIIRAVSRMLPNNKMGRKMLTRLRVYAGAEHQQKSQKPIALDQ